MHSSEPAREGEPARDPRASHATLWLGLCGVPGFHVSDGDRGVLFWGQDRLDQVALALGGWRPRSEQELSP